MSERRWSVETLIGEHPRIALDANVLIYLIDDAEPLGSLAGAVVDAIGPGGLRASMATIGQVEILAGPARSGDAVAFERTADEIRSVGLDILPLTADIAEDAAWIRGQGPLGLADAIHVASARAAGATALITNDRRIRSRPGLDIYHLDNLDLSDSVP